MHIFFALFIAQFIGDWLLQEPAFFMLKRVNIFVLLLHTTIWSICISIALKSQKRFKWWKFWFSLVVPLIDYWKLHFNPYPSSLRIMIIDQVLHMLQILAVSKKVEKNNTSQSFHELGWCQFFLLLYM